MKLHTKCYLPEPAQEPANPTVGLRDLRKGLDCILLGYLLSLGAVLVSGGVVWALLAEAGGGLLSQAALERASTVLFGMAMLLVLAGFGSLSLIIRGKWLCLSSAPERFHAKWMMFLSILCIVAGPLLNAGGYLVGESNSNARRRSNQTPSLIRIQRELKAYKDGMPEMDTRAYVALAGKVIGLFSGVFLVLFLRAVSLSWGASVRARLAELHLLFVALLAFGVVVLVRNPSFMMARPRLLLGLGAGWLLAGMWYFGLILSISARISTILDPRSRQPESVPAPPSTSSLPPLPELANWDSKSG
jgi:hypothetical protein